MNARVLSRAYFPAFLALAAGAAYANSLANRFAYDDVAIIHDDVRVHGLHHLAAIFSRPYWADYGRALGLYRPATTLAFALEWTLGAGAPWLFHLASVALHAAVCVLLFLLLERLVGQLGALLGALVFAVHPLHTEVVANIVGQAELLAGLGVLAACLAWTRRPDAGPLPRRTLAGVAVAYALAVFAKESAIVVPALLVTLDLAQRRVTLSRDSLLPYLRRVLPTMAVLTGIALLYLLARRAVIGSFAGGDVAPSIPFLARDHFWMGLRAWQEYLRLLVFPADLSSDYSPAVILPVHGWTAETLLGGGLLAGVVLLALATPWRPGIGLPAAWFLLTVLIVSNLFFPIGVLLAERTLYLPSVAVAIAVAFATPELAARYPRPALAVAAGVLLLALAARTWVRNPDWRDQNAVVEAMVRDHPESYRAQWHVAVRAAEHKDTVAADEAWLLAYRLWPGDSRLLSEFASYSIGRGRASFALNLLRQSLAIHPGDQRAQELVATALITLGRNREALAATDPLLPALADAPAVNDLRARAYMGLGDFPSAVGAWRKVVAAHRATWLQWSGLGRSLARSGDYQGALAALDSARLRAAADTAALRQVAGFRLLTEKEIAGGAQRPPVRGR